jgi:hypothetical protein
MSFSTVSEDVRPPIKRASSFEKTAHRSDELGGASSPGRYRYSARTVIDRNARSTLLRHWTGADLRVGRRFEKRMNRFWSPKKPSLASEVLETPTPWGLREKRGESIRCFLIPTARYSIRKTGAGVSDRAEGMTLFSQQPDNGKSICDQTGE